MSRHPEATFFLLILAALALVGFSAVHEVIGLAHQIGASLDAYLSGAAS